MKSLYFEKYIIIKQNYNKIEATCMRFLLNFFLQNLKMYLLIKVLLTKNFFFLRNYFVSFLTSRKLSTEKTRGVFFLSSWRSCTKKFISASRFAVFQTSPDSRTAINYREKH